jgi:AraC-like DNA-binding protein
VLIARALQQYDCDPKPLFRQVDIDIDCIDDPNSRYPVSKLQPLWRLAVEASGDPGFGISVAEQFQPSALRGLGFSWLASDTLRDAFSRLIRFSRFLNSAMVLRLEDEGDESHLVFTGPEQWPDFVYAAADMAMATILRMCQITASKPIQPRCVDMQRPGLKDTRRFEEFFLAPIRYGTDVNRLCFDRSVVDAALATPNPELARLSDQTVIDYLARFDKNSIAMQVRSRIIEQLPDGAPRQEKIADALHISLRSLQRRLKDENTSFRELLEETRHELAMQYIHETHRPIGEITYLLGFAEHSNFTRAFRRWTGNSPAGFRNGQTR